MTEPIRVLRLIARLNMGGPALHVAYLTKGLAVCASLRSSPRKTAVVAGSTTSGTPPTRVATTGRPAASASIATTGVPSFADGSTRASKNE